MCGGDDGEDTVGELAAEGARVLDVGGALQAVVEGALVRVVAVEVEVVAAHLRVHAAAPPDAQRLLARGGAEGGAQLARPPLLPPPARGLRLQQAVVERVAQRQCLWLCLHSICLQTIVFHKCGGNLHFWWQTQVANSGSNYAKHNKC